METSIRTSTDDRANLVFRLSVIGEEDSAEYALCILHTDFNKLPIRDMKTPKISANPYSG